MSTEKQLVTIEESNALTLFTNPNGLDPVIQNIRTLIDEFKPDTSTVKGRSEIASIAHSVARSKTYLDNVGKQLVDKLKEQPKLVDAERKRIRDLLDSWKDEVREPLTKLEVAEKEASESLESLLLTDELSADEIAANLEEAKGFDVSFAVIKPKDIEQLKDRVVNTLTVRFDKQKAYEDQQAEIERRRIEDEQRAIKEREERIRQEAIEQERRESEAKAQREREAAEKARIEKEQAEQRQREEEQRKIQEEKLAAERREMELKLQAEVAERRAVEAAEQERQRIKREQEAELEAQRKAAANKAHRKQVNNEILNLLVQAGISEDDAKTVITLAAKGQSGRLVVNY